MCIHNLFTHNRLTRTIAQELARAQSLQSFNQEVFSYWKFGQIAIFSPHSFPIYDTFYNCLFCHSPQLLVLVCEVVQKATNSWILCIHGLPGLCLCLDKKLTLVLTKESSFTNGSFGYYTLSLAFYVGYLERIGRD